MYHTLSMNYRSDVSSTTSSVNSNDNNKNRVSDFKSKFEKKPQETKTSANNNISNSSPEKSIGNNITERPNTTTTHSSPAHRADLSSSSNVQQQDVKSDKILSSSSDNCDNSVDKGQLQKKSSIIENFQVTTEKIQQNSSPEKSPRLFSPNKRLNEAINQEVLKPEAPVYSNLEELNKR